MSPQNQTLDIPAAPPPSGTGDAPCAQLQAENEQLVLTLRRLDRELLIMRKTLESIAGSAALSNHWAHRSACAEAATGLEIARRSLLS